MAFWWLLGADPWRKRCGVVVTLVCPCSMTFRPISPPTFCIFHETTRSASRLRSAECIERVDCLKIEIRYTQNNSARSYNQAHYWMGNRSIVPVPEFSSAACRLIIDSMLNVPEITAMLQLFTSILHWNNMDGVSMQTMFPFISYVSFHCGPNKTDKYRTVSDQLSILRWYMRTSIA